MRTAVAARAGCILRFAKMKRISVFSIQLVSLNQTFIPSEKREHLHGIFYFRSQWTPQSRYTESTVRSRKFYAPPTIAPARARQLFKTLWIRRTELDLSNVRHTVVTIPRDNISNVHWLISHILISVSLCALPSLWPHNKFIVNIYANMKSNLEIRMGRTSRQALNLCHDFCFASHWD